MYALVNQAIIGSATGLSLDRRQAIIWTNVGMLVIRPLLDKFQWNSDKKIQQLSHKMMKLKMSLCKSGHFFLPQYIIYHLSWETN